MTKELEEMNQLRFWLSKFKNFGAVQLMNKNIFSKKRTLRVITDSFGAFGWASKGAKNPQTCSAELLTLSDDIVYPWNVNSLCGGGSKSLPMLSSKSKTSASSNGLRERRTWEALKPTKCW